MSRRVWIWTALALLLAGAVLLLPERQAYANLRCSHSEPASIIPQQQVIVTDDGSTFHAPGCKYIQGKNPHFIAGSQAVAKGYAPCVRCMRWTLGK
jgi:hypothetical protein